MTILPTVFTAATAHRPSCDRRGRNQVIPRVRLSSNAWRRVGQTCERMDEAAGHDGRVLGRSARSFCRGNDVCRRAISIEIGCVTLCISTCMQVQVRLARRHDVALVRVEVSHNRRSTRVRRVTLLNAIVDAPCQQRDTQDQQQPARRLPSESCLDGPRHQDRLVPRAHFPEGWNNTPRKAASASVSCCIFAPVCGALFTRIAGLLFGRRMTP